MSSLQTVGYDALAQNEAWWDLGLARRVLLRLIAPRYVAATARTENDARRALPQPRRFLAPPVSPFAGSRR